MPASPRGGRRSAHRLRRPLPRRTRAELAASPSRRRSPPDVGDGRQDHHRLRDADEQGPRGHRGPPPVRHGYERIDVVVHPQSIVHSLSSCRRRRARPPRLPDMRVPISYALHYPERSTFRSRRSTWPRWGADLRAGRRGGVPVPAARPRGGRRRRHRAVRAQRRQRGRRARLPRPAAGLPRHPRGHRGDARAAPGRAVARLRVALRGRPRGPRGRRRAVRSARELAARLPGLRRADHSARVRALHRGQGRRHARRALLALLPADAVQVRRGETEYGIGAIPLGRLREDHRDEPARGAPAGGRAPGLRPPAAMEAHRRHQRRPGDEPPRRLRARLGHRRLPRRSDQRRRRATGRERGAPPRASCNPATR